jgi:hypothetical protein
VRPSDTPTADVNTKAADSDKYARAAYACATIANTDEHTPATTDSDEHIGAAYPCATDVNTDGTAVPSPTDADTDTITLPIVVSRCDLGQY